MNLQSRLSPFRPSRVVSSSVIALVLVAIFVSAATLRASTGSWTTLAPLPVAVGEAASGSINGLLYVAGGFNVWLVPLNVLQAYNPTTNSWTIKASMPTARVGAASAAINGKLYVAGGEDYTASHLSVLEAYDPATDAWTTLAPMPTSQVVGRGASLDGKFYVVGDGVLQVYDPVIDTWTTKAAAMADCCMGAAAVNGRLYVVGGIVGSATANILDVYDPNTDMWTPKVPMPTAGALLVASVVGGRLYAIGGEVYESGVGPVYDVNEVYDPATDVWTTDVPMPTARIEMVSEVINGRVYVVGGATDYPFTTIPVVEAFTPASTPTPYGAAIQPPINLDGSSVFNVKRGVVPVKFKLAVNGSPTCQLPPATISLSRVAGATLGVINESNYTEPSDAGSNFRVTDCQYIYNLGSSALGSGTYLVTINVAGVAVGNGTFSLT